MKYKVTVSMDEELYKYFKKYCVDKDTVMSRTFERAVKNFLDKEEGKEAKTSENGTIIVE